MPLVFNDNASPGEAFRMCSLDVACVDGGHRTNPVNVWPMQDLDIACVDGSDRTNPVNISPVQDLGENTESIVISMFI